MSPGFAAAARTVLIFLSALPNWAADPHAVIGPGWVERGKARDPKMGFEDADSGDEFEAAPIAYRQGFWSGSNFQRRTAGGWNGMRAPEIERGAMTRGLLEWFAADLGAPLFTRPWVGFNGFAAAGAPG